MIPFRKFVNIQKISECSSYIPLMLILLPTFENTSDIFLYFVVDYQSEHPPLAKDHHLLPIFPWSSTQEKRR